MVDGSSLGLRRQLVDYLRREGHLRDDRVAAAFIDVPREVFLPEHAERYGLDAVYRDDAIVTRRDPRSGLPLSSSSQPAIMAKMLEMLAVEDGQRVLEIGAGTGYNAALLDRLAGDGRVTSVEIDGEAAAEARDALREVGASVRVVVGDGRSLTPAVGAAFDALIVTASTETIPRAWHDQLVPGGRLVVPLRLCSLAFSIQVVVALGKVAHGFDTVAVTPGGFMALRGATSATDGAVPRLVAHQATAEPGVDSPLLELTGPALAGLDRRARQRLVVTALGFARRADMDLGPCAAPWALASYATLALPVERLVQVLRARPPADGAYALGVLDAGDGSLAALSTAPSGARLEGYGGRGAERVLAQAVERWTLAGRPGVDRLAVTVRYGGERPHAWRTARRGDQWLAFDWAE